MFSSNQKLEISGCIEHKNELKNALDFAIKASGWYEPFTRTEKTVKCTFQITPDGRYCLGWGGQDSGWQSFPFDFDVDIIAQIIVQHLRKQEIHGSFGDGSCDKGFLMKNIENYYSTERDGIKEPAYGIVSFEPYTCYYAK